MNADEFGDLLARIRELEAEVTRLRDAARTPNTSLSPLRGDAPGRKMLIEIEVSADFTKRLDNQWEVEREINADRWKWAWGSLPTDEDSSTPKGKVEKCGKCGGFSGDMGEDGCICADGKPQPVPSGVSDA